MKASRRLITRKRLPAVAPPPTDEVGYAKPPIATRFKPGRSGNPKGRPRGAKNKRKSIKEPQEISDIFLKVAARRLIVTKNGRQTSLSSIEAIAQSMVNDALKGNRGARRDFIKLLENAERERRQRTDDASYAEWHRLNNLTAAELQQEIEQDVAAMGLKIIKRPTDEEV